MMTTDTPNNAPRRARAALIASLVGASALLGLVAVDPGSNALAQKRPSQPQAGGPSGNTPGAGGTTSPGGGKPTTSPGGGGGKPRAAGGFVVR